MNLIEAIKSGKRFRRPDDEWHLIKNEIISYDGDQYDGEAFTLKDVLSDEWEIEESEVDKLKATIEELNIDIWSLKEQNKRLANDYQEMKQRELLRKR